MKLNWYLARLRRMSPGEVMWRTVQMTRLHTAPLIRSRSNVAQEAISVRQSLSPIKEPMQISFFDELFDWSGQEIQWQGDYRNSSLENVYRAKINYRDTARYGDPKRIWELSRQQFLRTCATNEKTPVLDRANSVSHLILHWIEKNPYELGLNWCSALEAALRVISWESAMESIGIQHFSPAVKAVIEKSVVEHGRFLRENPSLFSSANNHRIGELVGQIAASTLFPVNGELRKGAQKAWSHIQGEARNQISSDGVCREQAFYYHAYVLLYFKNAQHYAAALKLHIPREFSTVIEKMQSVLDAVTDGNGNWFEIGDRDDGNLVALLPLAHAGAPISQPCRPGTWVLRDGGYAIWKSEQFHVLFRCGEFGYPSIAAHSHCDQLSVLLKINDREILADSGTCDYHDNEKWRRYFRGTSAHNTVRISGGDQAEYGGPFLWNSAPWGHFTEVAENSITGITGAWRTGANPVDHQRTVAFDQDNRVFLQITDKVIPVHSRSANNHCELIWNFGPGVTLNAQSCPDNTFNALIQVDGAPVIALNVKSSTAITHEIFCGDESIPAGFYSRKFGERIPITQLRISCHAIHWTVTSSFQLADQV